MCSSHGEYLAKATSGATGGINVSMRGHVKIVRAQLPHAWERVTKINVPQ